MKNAGKNHAFGNANKFNIADSQLGPDFDDIFLNGDSSKPPGWGKKTENLLKNILDDSGNGPFTHFDGSYNGPSDGVNGFDGVFVKGNLSNPSEIIINESKQFTSGGITLNGPGPGPDGIAPQMTNQWVFDVCAKLRLQGKADLADAIESALFDGKLTKIVTAIDRTSSGNPAGLLGGVNIIKIN